MTGADADLNHLFGIKKPFLAPLYLSVPLNLARCLTPDEAAQICERDSAIKPTTRDTWQLSPVYVDGRLEAMLQKMSQRGGWHAAATWQLPTAPGYGMLRLAKPLGSGRALTKDECRQLRSIDTCYAGVNPTWSVTPTANDRVVDIVRDIGRKTIRVGTLTLAQEVVTPDVRNETRRRISMGSLPARCVAQLSVIF